MNNGILTEYTTDRESAYSQTFIKREYEKNVFGSYTEPVSSTTYTYVLGLVSERRDTGEEYYYHYNHLGSTMAVSDGSGEVIYRFVYGTYGELYDVKDGNGGSLGNIAASEGYTYAELAHALGMEYLYNGQYGVSTDMDRLYYMRARYYDQTVKRFINRDVLSGDIGNSQSLNRFCYVQGNPVSLSDPFGLCPDGNGKIENLASQMFSSASGMLSFMTEKPFVSWKDVGKAGLVLLWIGGDPVTSLQQLYVYAVAAELDWSAIGHTLLGLALKVIGKGFTLGFAAESTFESISRAYDAYKDGTLSWWNALDVGVNVLGFGLSARGFKGTFGDVLAGRTEPGILSRITRMNNGGYLDLDALGIAKPKPLKGNVADEAAEKLGYSKTNYRSHGQPVYRKGNRYITPDVDSHNGGSWKMADSVKNLGSRTRRMGTYDENLNRIGD